MHILKRVYSWLLAMAYLSFGVLLFADVQWMQESFSMSVWQPFRLRAFLALGPYSCFILMAAVAAFLILNDIKYHRRFISLAFSIILLVLIYQLAAANIPDFDFQFIRDAA